jgi:hypothetical protein
VLIPTNATNVVAIAAGDLHSLALTTDGRVVGWGAGTFVADPFDAANLGQVLIPTNATNVVAIAAGGRHSLALRADGTVVGWGNNSYGQTIPASATNVVAIAAGGQHSLALLADGSVVGWGLNSHGEATGVPSPAQPYDSSGPVIIGGQPLSNVVAIAAGGQHSLALLADGTVVAWGDNQYGQCEVPAEATDVIEIACWYLHNLALRADGTVVAWGNNWYGQTEVPTGLSNVVAIAAGGYHNQALLADGTVIGWGNNSRGQITIPPNLSNLRISVSGTVEVDVLGTYVLTYRATNALGAVTTATRTVVVAPTVPWVSTSPVSYLGSDTATLNGTTHSGGLPTRAWFEWGTTTEYGSVTASTGIGSGPVPVAISFTLTNLTRNAAYHYRVVASNSLGVARSADASFRTLPKAMTFGAIPDQTVWHGSTNEFYLCWTGGTPVSLALEAFPLQSGVFSLTPCSETHWLFQYVPGPADITPFTVTITAAGGQTVSQSFLITPQPVLPPEQTVFGTDRHTQPVAVTTYGMTIFDRASPTPESLNYQSTNVRSVRIIGETVEIQAGHTNGLYEAYFNSDETLARRDLKEMEIIVERLTIRSPVRLKQTDLTIYARELRFEGAGQIKTTPEEITTSPGTGLTGGLPGADGLRAGNVTLHIGTLSSDAPGLKFELAGGRGQQGGPGQDGIDGWDNPNAWNNATVFHALTGYHTYWASPPWSIISYDFNNDRWGTAVWPGDGTDALPSGKPGKGGNGGTNISSIDISGTLSLVGGPAGTVPSCPLGFYRGGFAGSPQYALLVHFYFSSLWTIDHELQGTRISNAGTNAPLIYPNSPAGPVGSYRLERSTNSWVHPLLVRKILAHAKDDYLGSRIAEAEARLQEYVSVINTCKADTIYWASLSPMDQLELEQMYNEMQILLQRMANGLDYFGNPAGWVPMLSFEVNQTLFNNEIDRAIDMLYLAYWIKSKAATEQEKVKALSAARDKLRGEIAQAKVDYSNAVEQLPVLKNKALTLQNRVLETQMEMQAKENELLQQTGDPDWLAGLKFCLKGAASICQMIPVYQPALGSAGGGLRLLSDLDPDKPWDTITGAADLTTAYLKSEYEATAKAQQNKTKGIDPNQVESNTLGYLDDLRTASAGLSAGLKDIGGFLSSQQAPNSEIQAELEQLKSQSPEYQALVKKVEGLLAEKRKFADELISTMQTVATLSDLITRDILAIDAMNRQVAAGLTVLDERATSYLGDMERRAYDRLLKYHYYMAKAYEYRLLQPYTAPLNLEGLITEFQKIADLNTNQSITVDQFDTLKSVFKTTLAQVAETIFDQYNSSPPDLSAPIRFSLTSNEIARLNNNETITLNLMNEGWFFPDEENVRIYDLQIFSIETEPLGGSYGNPAYVDVNMEHSGISNLKSDGAVHQFRHYNRQTQNPILWGGRYDPVNDQIDPIRPSAASDSLLRSLLSGAAVADMLLYSRPSAWADLTISRRVMDVGRPGINITSLWLEVQYDFTRRSQLQPRRDLKVLVMTALRQGAGATVLEESSLTPYFVVNAPDCNGRQDARGRFLRTYLQGPTPVRLTAQQEYGPLWFSKWTDEFGSDLPGGPHTSPTIDVVMQTDQTICAQYVSTTSVPRILSRPRFSGAGDVFTLSWNGCGKLKLQTTDSLTPPINWQEVPGSVSRSSIELPRTQRTMFFRLVLP